MNRSLAATAATLCTAAVMCPATALAQAKDDWQFAAMLYLYLPTISGQTTFVPPGGGSSSGVADNCRSHSATINSARFSPSPRAT